MAETELTFSLYDRAKRLQKTLPFTETEMEILNKVNWDIHFLMDLVIAAYTDAFVRANNQAIPGLNAPETVHTVLDEGLTELAETFMGGIEVVDVRDLKAKKEQMALFRKMMVTWFYETVDDLQKEIYKIIGTNRTFDVWSARVDHSENTITFINEGDFRILEWQREHIDEDGVYHNDLDLENGELVYNTVPMFFEKKSLKGTTVMILGFGNEPKIGETMHTEKQLATMLRNIDGKPVLRASTNVEYAIRPDDAQMTEELWNRVKETTLFIPNVKWLTEGQFIQYMEQ